MPPLGLALVPPLVLPLWMLPALAVVCTDQKEALPSNDQYHL
jgi:hypothetical protein